MWRLLLLRRFLPLGVPLLLSRLLGFLALLFFATLAFALLGFTSLAGEPLGWARVLTVVSGVLLLAVLAAVVVLVRKALAVLAQGKKALRRFTRAA